MIIFSGKENPYLCSTFLIPEIGASIVMTIDLKPKLSAFCISYKFVFAFMIKKPTKNSLVYPINLDIQRITGYY